MSETKTLLPLLGKKVSTDCRSSVYRQFIASQRHNQKNSFNSVLPICNGPTGQEFSLTCFRQEKNYSSKSSATGQQGEVIALDVAVTPAYMMIGGMAISHSKQILLHTLLFLVQQILSEGKSFVKEVNQAVYMQLYRLNYTE